MAAIYLTAYYKSVEYTMPIQGWSDMTGRTKTNFRKNVYYVLDAGGSHQEAIDYALSDRRRKKVGHQFNKNSVDYKIETTKIKHEEKQLRENKKSWDLLIFGGGLTRGII